MLQLGAIFALWAVAWSGARADPCRINNGGCDSNNGLCWGTGARSHFCSCKAGYRDSGLAMHFCIDVDECQEDPALCPENAVCQNTDGGYTCTCRCGYVMDYTGQRCLDPEQIDGMCQVPKTCTHKDGTGQTRPFGTQHTDFVSDFSDMRTFAKKAASKEDRDGCRCPDGMEFNRCGYCVDIDECLTGNPCPGFQSVCTNTEGSYYCSCNPGYTLGPCGIRCYRSTGEIPDMCPDDDMDELEVKGIKYRSFVRPKRLKNWRSCPRGFEEGATITERFSTTRSKQPDLFLTWTCAFDRSMSRKGLVTVLKSVGEEKAKWGPWSCWTACKATCWGGLQTRERKCLNGLPSRGPCRGAGTEKRNCYHGTLCPFRVRKDALALNQREQRDLLQAMQKYKADKSVKGFHHAASAHGWPGQCEGRPCCPHEKKAEFMAWHRSIILNFEEGLSRYLQDKTIGIPYWNWLRSGNPPDIVWKKNIDGSPNPFTQMTVRIDTDNQGIGRSTNVAQSRLDSATRTWGDVATKYYRPYSVLEFSAALYDAHGSPHMAVCHEWGTRKCSISMAPLMFSSFDPIFMFHHCQVDRLWAVAQYEVEKDGNATWTTQTALEAMEPEGNFGKAHMPFGNRTINAFPIVQAVNNRRDSYYYEELTGVKYDDLERNGFPDEAAKARPPGEEALFIAQYLQSVDENVEINYYRMSKGPSCATASSSLFLGSTVLLGNTEAYRNTVPRITPVERGISNWQLWREYPVSACYDVQPGVNDPRVNSLPDPFLVYYVPNQAIDIFKYQWQSGIRFPTWRVTIHAKTQWVFFYGARSGMIRQVRSRREWMNCNTARSRPFPCNEDACVLKQGRYYLVDSSQTECQRGLRFQIISVE